jgi:hypothetical protein
MPRLKPAQRSRSALLLDRRRLASAHEIGRYFQAASTKLKSKNFDAGGTGTVRSPH